MFGPAATSSAPKANLSSLFTRPRYPNLTNDAGNSICFSEFARSASSRNIQTLRVELSFRVHRFIEIYLRLMRLEALEQSWIFGELLCPLNG